ncbi:MAG: OmpA family protein [uncultured Sulfurovum sp.]|uniref:OmpA family protein n=1 Tax=uncultured Sulfurovum sp. TaxID=269237 RepID=A0A6S6T6U9_9BACT|nr:MAG: OmpA family protein [uncultured Sulfurovum sp.]
MNRNKFILILLFLLLLLIIICTWCHAGKIVENQTTPAQKNLPTKTSISHVNHAIPINFHLIKHKNTFELTGNFSNQKQVEEIRASLGLNTLKEHTNIDTNLSEKTDVIALIKQIIPIFYNKYKNAHLSYKEGEIIIEGVTETQANKDTISTLLANSTIPSKNNTLIVSLEPKVEKLTELKVIAEERIEKIERKIKKIIAFQDINFELNKATLTEQSINTISQIADILKENPNVHIEIGGHSDNSGNEMHNLKLSQARVDKVKEQLTNMMVPSNKIRAIGYGASKPLVSNDTEENRRINRRVEFKILGE